MTQIAEKSGFGTLHRMKRVYREILGLTPSQCRSNFKHSFAVNFEAFPGEKG